MGHRWPGEDGDLDTGEGGAGLGVTEGLSAVVGSLELLESGSR